MIKRLTSRIYPTPLPKRAPEKGAFLIKFPEKFGICGNFGAGSGFFDTDP